MMAYLRIVKKEKAPSCQNESVHPAVATERIVSRAHSKFFVSCFQTGTTCYDPLSFFLPPDARQTSFARKKNHFTSVAASVFLLPLGQTMATLHAVLRRAAGLDAEPQNLSASIKEATVQVSLLNRSKVCFASR